MSTAPSVPAALLAPLDDVAERGVVYVVPPKAGSLRRALLAAGRDKGLEVLELDAAREGWVAGGVVAALVPEFLRGTTEARGLVDDALGDGQGADDAWRRVVGGDAGAAGDEGFGDLLLADAAVRGRVLTAAGDLAGRIVGLRNTDGMDDASARALRGLLCGGAAGGWVLVMAAPERGPALRLLEALRETSADERLDSARLVEVPARKKKGGDAPREEDGPNLPSKGSAVELLSILSAAEMPLPESVVGTDALARYRGTAPRRGWEDLQGLLDAKVADAADGLVRLRRSNPGAGVVRRADARALRDAVEEVLALDDPIRGRLVAGLALAGGAADADACCISAASDALDLGEAAAATALLQAGGPSVSAPLLRARAARLRGDPAEALRHARDARSEGDGPAALLEVALASEAVGKGAEEAWESVAEAAEADDLGDLLGRARMALGLLQERAGDFVGAARTYGEAAKAYDGAGDDLSAGRAFARRAVTMAKAGAPDRAVREVRLAMERAPDLDDPRLSALDVRILMGVVFREAGSRDKARQALALAAEKAARHASPRHEAEARLLAARFHLEALPVRGAERGEALRDGREAAEAAILLARGAGLVALEAEAEAVLGELSWRSEDWVGAGASLDRQGVLWARAHRPDQEVDAAIRRGRLAGRMDDWETAFRAGVAALTLSSKRRLKEQAAQAQLLRGEALQNLDRGSEAVEAFSEAQRIFSSLGEAFAAQARAAEQRARQAIQGG